MEDGDINEEEKKQRQRRAVKNFAGSGGIKTLERSDNLKIKNFDMEFDIDPTVKQLKIKNLENPVASLFVNKIQTLSDCTLSMAYGNDSDEQIIF